MFDPNLFQLPEKYNTYILIGQVGSKSYGLDTPESDDDWMAVVVPPMSHFTGLKSWEFDGTLKIDRKSTDNAELTAYELRKFLKLMLAFNPNVIPLLYLREQDYALVTPSGRFLINNRKLFESKRAGTTLLGYAQSQMKKVIDGDTGKLGEKRKHLVEKYGYDTKFAAHTLRILIMAEEFFKTGELNVYREYNRPFLLSIRNGKWELEEWLRLAQDQIELTREAEKIADLPDEPDFEAVNRLCMQVVYDNSIYDEELMFP